MALELHNLLITGGAGFIGSHAVRLFAKKYPQYSIVVLDKIDYCSSPHVIEDAFPNVRLIRGNLLDANLVLTTLTENKIDAVVHFAANTHVDLSFGNSVSFTHNNTVATHTLLECVRAYGQVKRFVHVSTDEVYGDGGDDSKEDVTMKPTNPYACTKACAEIMCAGFRISYGIPLIITRGNNVYGPQQFPDKLIPKSACLLLRDRLVFIHGSGDHTRNFMHVADAAAAFDIILHRGVVGETYNIGSRDEQSNLKVATDLVKLVHGADADISHHIVHCDDRTVNDVRYSINCDKLCALGWSQQVSWETGLKETLDWYRDPANLAHWERCDEALVPHPRMN